MFSYEKIGFSNLTSAPAVERVVEFSPSGIDAAAIVRVLSLAADGKAVSAEAGDDADMLSARPDAMILCYPVISFARFAHEGSGRNLLGEHFEQWKERFSLETRVTEKTPPAFLWHTAEDLTVPWRNSAMMAEALYEKKIPCSLHIFPHGGHGMLLGNGTLDVVQWPEMAKRFLIRTCGFEIPPFSV